MRRRRSDCRGDVETRFSKDDLLTTIMIYWVTQSYGTSARYYYEAANSPWTPVHDRMPVVEAPVGISVLPQEIFSAPRRWPVAGVIGGDDQADARLAGAEVGVP